MYKIELVNKNTQEIHSFDNLTDINDGEKLYYKFALNMSDIADGEYSLSLYEDDKLIASDSLTIGDFDIKGIQAQKGDNIYISTEMNVITEEKNVDITDIVTIIEPTDGIDAMTKVEVNAQAIRDNAFTEGFESGNNDGYNIGYNSGITDGQNNIINKSVELNITQNGTYTTKYSGGDGGLINKVNVKVIAEGGLDFSSIGYTQEQTDSLNASYNEGIRYAEKIKNEWTNPMSGYNKFASDVNLRYFPNVDTSSLTDMRRMFDTCKNLTFMPMMNTSKVTDMSNCFFDCISLIEVPAFNLINCKNLFNCFNGCTNLETVGFINTYNVTTMESTFDECKKLKTIPKFNTSKVTNFKCTFRNSGITTIPDLDTSSATDVYGMFWGASSLQSLPLLDFSKVTSIGYFLAFLYNGNNITDLGGFKNLKVDWNDNYGLSVAQSLTYQSVLNVINNLYDFRANGDTSTTKTLKLHKNGYALLSEDDLLIATNKGWVITT